MEVFGVTHDTPRDDHRAENHLERWGFAPRRRGDGWQVHTYTREGGDENLADRPRTQAWEFPNH